jgi:hypothetical protein
MTDSALPVTQSAVEMFTENYLTTVGCKIEKEGDRWFVTPDESADTDLFSERVTLNCGADPAEHNEDTKVLHPESAFFQELLTEASDRSPAGMVTISAEETEVDIPSWLTNEHVDVTDATFVPYYDRTAVVLIFEISVETVSEYQQELLQAVAVDTRSKECLPGLEDTFLTMSGPSAEGPESDPGKIDREQARSCIEEAREIVVDRVQSHIDEIHQEASRAADAELEEYRQLQQQQIEELDEQASTLSGEIAELSQSIKNSDKSERVELLKKRKKSKSELDDIQAELEDLRRKREHGFPTKQQEIRDRHALEVVVTPLTITQVEYERGEVEFILSEDNTTRRLAVGYGNGVGLTETVRCESCNHPLNEQNPLHTIEPELQCNSCFSQTN